MNQNCDSLGIKLDPPLPFLTHLCQGGCEHVDDVADYADHGETDEDDHPKPQEDVNLSE